MAFRDENLVRDFPGNPNPTPKAPQNVPSPRPAPAPASSSGGGSVPLKEPTGPSAPSFAEGSYSVTDNEGGERDIYFTGPDGNFEKIGSTSIPDAKDLLDKAGTYNPVTGAWQVPKDVALSLSKGNMPLPEFVKKMYSSGEATVVRGLWGDKWIFGGTSREDAQAHGNIERLKMISNEHPSLAWSEAPFAKFAGELRWGLGEAVGLAPFMAGAAGESFKTAAYWGAALPAVTAMTLGPGAPALSNPLALAGLIGTGASAGASYGAARYTMKIEGGNLALDMLDKGFSEKTTRAIAPAAGAVIGLLEIAGLKYMTAPMKRAFFSKVVLSEPMQKVMASWYTNYAKELGAEVSIEMAQQAVTEASKALGALAEQNPDLLSSKEEIINGFTQTFASSVVGMGLLKLPGVALDIRTERAQKSAMASLRAEAADGGKTMSPEQVEKVLMADAGKQPVIEAKKLNDILAGKEAVEAPNPIEEAPTPTQLAALKATTVSDAGGKPIKVYHGTQKMFDTYELGKEGNISILGMSTKVKRHAIFFAEDAALAQEFADQGDKKGIVKSAFLDIKHPLDLTRRLSDVDFNTLVNFGISKNILAHIEDHKTDAWWLFDEDRGGAKNVAALKELGYDGVKMVERAEGDIENTISYAVFSPAQIHTPIPPKSASAAFDYGVANSNNTAAKIAVAAKAKALKFSIQQAIDEAGGEAKNLTPEAAAKVLPMAENLRTLSDVAEGMNAPKSLGAAAAQEPMLPSKEAKTAPEFIERRFREQEAVTKALAKEAEALDRELTAVNDEIVTRTEEGLTTVALREKANKLAAQIQDVEARGAEIVMSPMGQEEALATRLSESGAEGIIRASELVNMERDLAARVERAHVSAFRHGAAYAKREVARVQTYINTLIDRSALPKEDKAKFMAVMRNTKTIEDLDRNYPEIRDRIFKAEDEARAAASATMLAKLLKANKVKTQAGKPVSKIGDPLVQRIVDNARGVMKMTRTEAEDNLTAEAYERFVASFDDTKEGYSPEKNAEEYYKYKSLEYRAGRMKHGSDAMKFAKDIADMVAGAKGRFLERKKAEAEARKVLKSNLSSEMRGNVELPPDWKNVETKDFGWVHGAELAKSKAWVIGDGWIADLDGLADILSSRAAAKRGESLLSKTFHTLDSALAEDAAQNEFHGLMRDAYAEAYEFEGSDAEIDRQIRRQHVRDFERHKLAGPEGGKFKNAKGALVELEYSVAEARKRFMERQDPTLSENFTHPEAMAYTPEMENAIFGLLTEQDRKFALGQIEAYREIYKRVNKTYREIFSVDLPFNEFYSPIKVVGYVEPEGADIGLAAVKQEVGARTTMGGSFKTRVKHYHALAQMADVEVYNRHTVNMAHFLAWEKKIREWNSILADGEFRASATGVYGSHTFRALKSAVEDITASDRKFQLFQGMDKLWSRLITAEVIFKPLAVPKQLTSIVAFADPVPVEHIHLLLKELAAPIKEKGFHPDILNSDFVKNRGMNFSRELKAFKDAVESGTIGDNPNIVEYGSKFIQWGDKASILIGGDALYRYLRKQGRTKEEALRIFAETAMKTQSSGITANLSALQRQNGFMRILTAYQNQPIQMMRKELEALRAIATEGFAQGEGRMSRGDVMKALIIYHFMMPMLYQFVIDWGWDEKNQKRAAVLGSFNSLPILTDAIASAYSIIFRDSAPNQGQGTIWDGWIRRGDKAANDLLKAHKLSDYVDALATLADFVSKARFGVPIQPAVNAAKGVAKATEGKVADGIRLVMGYSPYAVKKQNKRTGGNGTSELW